MTTDFDTQTKEPYAAINAHDLERFVSCHTEDVTVESVPDGNTLRGKDQLRTYINSYFGAFKDFRMELTSCVAGNNIQCEEWVISGTHTGPFQGIAPTGKSIALRGILVRELKNGKSCRVSNYFDSATLLRQLGLLPPVQKQ